MGNLDFRGLIYWPSPPQHVPGVWAAASVLALLVTLGTASWGWTTQGWREETEDQEGSLEVVRSPTLCPGVRIGAWRPKVKAQRTGVRTEDSGEELKIGICGLELEPPYLCSSPLTGFQRSGWWGEGMSLQG